jgi:hypothetical protein
METAVVPTDKLNAIEVALAQESFLFKAASGVYKMTKVADDLWMCSQSTDPGAGSATWEREEILHAFDHDWVGAKPWELVQNLTLEQALSKGYAIVSRMHRIASRIDRPDWKRSMAIRHSPWSLEDGMDWVRILGNRGAADQYRRVYSKDQIEVPISWVSKMPNSGDGPEVYKE